MSTEENMKGVATKESKNQKNEKSMDPAAFEGRDRANACGAQHEGRRGGGAGALRRASAADVVLTLYSHVASLL